MPDLSAATNSAFDILDTCSTHLARVDPAASADQAFELLYQVKVESPSVVSIACECQRVADALQAVLRRADRHPTSKRLRRARPALKQVLRAALTAFIAQDPDLHPAILEAYAGGLETALRSGSVDTTRASISALRDLVLPAVQALAPASFADRALAGSTVSFRVLRWSRPPSGWGAVRTRQRSPG